MYYGSAVMEQYASGEFSRVEFALQGDRDRVYAYPWGKTERAGSLVRTIHCLMGMVETDLISPI
jgi:hypothetical protein